jgi:RimJ/RimL family protein N-acetyltransferase
MYAIYDKTTSVEDAFAGITSLSDTNPTHASSEIGIIVLPWFQHTHVATNAVGLLLFWLLNPPKLGGLGLRRVEWRSHADNTQSRNFATKLGFEFEGIARWNRVVAPGKVGLDTEVLGKRNGLGEGVARAGRHTAIYSMVWDEWESKRESLKTRMVLRS